MYEIKIEWVLGACGEDDVSWVQWAWQTRYVEVRHRIPLRMPVREGEAWRKVNSSGEDYPSMMGIGPRI